MAIKRAFDVLCSALGLLVLALPMLIIGLLVRLDSPGPALFRQKRVGCGGTTFDILKFRTMRISSDGGLLITAADDDRITRLGAWLRRNKIDELPQLINVLVGDMSMVGPRPEVPEYAFLLPEQSEVWSVRPGITDPTAITLRNESTLLAAAADADEFYRTVLLPEKTAAYLRYIRTATLRSDIALIVRTLQELVGITPGAPTLPRPGAAATGIALVTAAIAGFAVSWVGTGEVLLSVIVAVIASFGAWLGLRTPATAVGLVLAITPLEQVSRLSSPVGWLTLSKTIFLGVVIAWVARRVSTRMEGRKAPRELWWLAGFTVMTLAAAQYSPGPRTLTTLGGLLAHIALLLLVVDVARTKKDVASMLTGVAAGAIGVVAAGVLDIIVGRSVFGTAAEHLIGSPVTGSLGLWRITSTFHDSNWLARYLVFAMLVCVGLLLEQGADSRYRTPLKVLVFAEMILMLITLSRAALFGALVAAAIVILPNSDRFVRFSRARIERVREVLLRQPVPVRVGIVALAALLIGAILVSFAGRFLGAASDPRFLITGAAMRLTAAHPLLGVGPGNIEAAMAGLLGSPASTHNLYLEIALTCGIPGLIAFGAFTVSVLRRATKAYAASGSSYVLALGAAVAGVLTIGLMLHGVGSDEVWVPLSLLLAAAIASPDHEPRRAQDQAR